MIIGISIQNYKGIKHVVKLPLGRFHVLVGPNGSGKSTFLDAIDFVRDCLEVGPLKAVENRKINDFNDLTWMRQGGNVAFDLWLDLESLVPGADAAIAQYHMSIGTDETLGVSVQEELLSVYSKKTTQPGKPLELRPSAKSQRLLGKTSKKSDFYQRENGRYTDSFVFGMDKLGLSQVPLDAKRYPTANAVRAFLMKGVRYIQLSSRAMRLPCPATRPTDLELDGTNLARVVGRLRGKNGVKPERNEIFVESEPIRRWREHLAYALPDLAAIGWDRQDSDNAEFILLKYANGLACPSWLLSDGTLRMLALTLPAFVPSSPSVYMIEEPENGVHPKALEIIMRSLSSIPSAQMLVATHSPLAVQQVGREPLLCFTRDDEGATVAPGSEHPALRDWDGTPDLATVFSAGVLG